VRRNLTEQTREAVDDAHLKATGRQPAQFLFPGRKGADRHLTTRQYARLFSLQTDKTGGLLRKS
jgi:hypothetical protein